MGLACAALIGTPSAGARASGQDLASVNAKILTQLDAFRETHPVDFAGLDALDDVL